MILYLVFQISGGRKSRCMEENARNTVHLAPLGTLGSRGSRAIHENYIAFRRHLFPPQSRRLPPYVLPRIHRV